MMKMIRKLALLLCITMTKLVAVTRSETVRLAECPKEPEVVGKFYNNGSKCVRDRTVKSRDTVDAQCPDGYEYASGYCRHRLHKKVKPTCPEDYQRTGPKCQSKCPYPYKTRYGECVLSQTTLNARFMTCPEGQHRYEAYCCTPGADCPQMECKVGTDVPGKFFFDESTKSCVRAAKSLARVTSAKLRGQDCPDGTVQIWGVCQEACPQGYRAMQGRCELRECSFNSTSDSLIVCPEGSYNVPKAWM